MLSRCSLCTGTEGRQEPAWTAVRHAVFPELLGYQVNTKASTFMNLKTSRKQLLYFKMTTYLSIDITVTEEFCVLRFAGWVPL